MDHKHRQLSLSRITYDPIILKTINLYMRTL